MFLQVVLWTLLFGMCLSAPTDNNNCVDDGFTAADNTYSCDYLTDATKDPHNILGFFNETTYCFKKTTNCCATCKLLGVQSTVPPQHHTGGACVDSNTDGIAIGELTFSCDYLTNKSRDPSGIYGIFGSYKYCLNPITSRMCCATCKSYLDTHSTPPSPQPQACVDGVEGISIAGGSYDCSLLTYKGPMEAILGIYSSRKNICGWKTTDCCASCAKVALEEDRTSAPGVITTAKVPVTTERRTQRPAKPTTPRVLMDKCSSGCIWVDGPTGTCADLHGNVNTAVALCNGDTFRNCEATCTAILTKAQEPESEAQQDTTAATAKTTTEGNIVINECSDNGYTYRGEKYDCADLLTPFGQSQSRVTQICDSKECCSTCKKLKAKPYDVQNEENDTNKVVKVDEVEVVEVKLTSDPVQLYNEVFTFFQRLQQMMKGFHRLQTNSIV